MPVRDRVNAQPNERLPVQLAPTGGVQGESILFRRLPGVIQNIIKEQWQSLRSELEQEELLFALESFSRYMIQAPEACTAREHNLEALVRVLLESIGLWQIVEAGDEDLRYHLKFLQEFFAKALTKLSVRQRQIIRLAANTGHTFAEIARVMNFTSIAAVEAFQHSAFRAIATTLSVLFSLELKQPEVESRRRAALLQWQEVLAQCAT